MKKIQSYAFDPMMTGAWSAFTVATALWLVTLVLWLGTYASLVRAEEIGVRAVEAGEAMQDELRKCRRADL